MVMDLEDRTRTHEKVIQEKRLEGKTSEVWPAALVAGASVH